MGEGQPTPKYVFLGGCYNNIAPFIGMGHIFLSAFGKNQDVPTNHFCNSENFLDTLYIPTRASQLFINRKPIQGKGNCIHQQQVQALAGDILPS